MYHQHPVRKVKTVYKTACKKAGRGVLRFHNLRHCAETNLRQAGVDTTTPMQIIGHKSLSCGYGITLWLKLAWVAAANKLHTYLSTTVLTPANIDETVHGISA